MDDRTLLELAAKAAGIELQRSRLEDPMCKDFLLVRRAEDNNGVGWNPLTDDGDALRLAVMLHIPLAFVRSFEHTEQRAYWSAMAGKCCEFQEELTDDQFAATRRAIVRAAAAIGEQML